jgi:glycosyltransferase involved in cell wall biosynthesis
VKVVLVTSGFNEGKPGGVSTVVLSILHILGARPGIDIQIANFSNSARDRLSLAILDPKTYGSKRSEVGTTSEGYVVSHFGNKVSELEFFRYKKRNDLTDYFSRFDIIIVVTGILQFANIVPYVEKPVFVCCATRLRWERKSQYSNMKTLRRILLHAQSPGLRILESRVMRRNFVFITINQKMQDWVSAKGKRRSVLWYPGTPALPISQKRKSNALAAHHFVSVGRFAETRKGWKRLILAYERAYKIDSSIPRLILIGWGDFEPEVQKILDSLDGNIPLRIVKNASMEQRDLLVRTASYFLQTSYEEGLGLAAIESLRFGVPLICSDTDGSREYINQGITGKIVPQGKNFIELFSSAILESRRWDRYQLSESCRELFNAKFSEEKASKEFFTILADFTRT